MMPMRFVSGIKRKGRWSKDYRDSESERENAAPISGSVGEHVQKFKRNTKNPRHSSPSTDLLGGISLEGQAVHGASKESRRARLRRGGSKILSIFGLGKSNGKARSRIKANLKLMLLAEATGQPWYRHLGP
jgi:hypothetical protein